MDPFHAAQIPSRLLEPLRAALRGELACWPETLTDEELRTLTEHGLAPLIYATQPLPQLRNAAIQAAAVEPLRADDLRTVLSTLAANGIPVLIMKGAALAYDLYPGPELRPRADVDLLVSRKDVAAAIATLKALGCVAPLTSGDEHAVRQLTLLRRDAFGVQHGYDLHWDASNTPVFASALRFDHLLERAIAIPRLGDHARGLSYPDALLLACIHRVAHHHDTQRLIWLADIDLLRLRMSPEENARFWREAAEARMVAVCSRSIELAEEWFSRPPHDRAEQWLTAAELSQDEPSRAFLNPGMTYGAEMLADFRALSWKARAQRAWQLAFPPPAFLQESFGTHNRLLLPWLYVRRGARGVARLFRRV